MKKIVGLLIACTLVSACENMSQYTTAGANASAQEKARACVLSEANARFEAGTLFTGTIKETAKSIADTCITRLALEKAGISTQTQTAAEEIITNLKALTSK